LRFALAHPLVDVCFTNHFNLARTRRGLEFFYQLCRPKLDIVNAIYRYFYRIFVLTHYKNIAGIELDGFYIYERFFVALRFL
jgi:hypothetical protein